MNTVLQPVPDFAEPAVREGRIMNDLITVSDGRTLPLRVAAYEASRLTNPASTVKAVCNAPFVNLDFGPRGQVSLCNHIYRCVATLTPEMGILDLWRGPLMGELRRNFERYCLDQACVHCIHQIETGHARETFAQQHFDQHAVTSREPDYPKRLILRLNSTCNLACIMCDSETSSRVRKERDLLPAYPSAYGEPFFRDMEEILPHVEYVEFYGGEPFLVAEHLRIMEMMLRLNCQARVFVNTNTVAFNNNARKYVERLNIHQIAVSMDAYHAEVHEAIRLGMDHQQFCSNLQWLLELGARRGFGVYLNVTEHRKNWFDLPNVFRFANEKGLLIHVNHCIAPDNVTLYNLPAAELAYVLEYWRQEYDSIYQSRAPKIYQSRTQKLNRASYEYMMSLAEGELKRRNGEWQPFLNWSNRAIDGALGAPIAGLPPFDRPERVKLEIARIAQLSFEHASVMLRHLLASIRLQSQKPKGARAWSQALLACTDALNNLAPPAASGSPLVQLPVSGAEKGLR